MNSVDSKTALQRLKDGNRRYRANLICLKTNAHGEKRPGLVAAQKPFAIILSCSDSRVPSEIVFDQGLGELFVIRVAGNVVAPSIIGSIEFAAATFGTELVVVMGHSRCGAVAAAMESELKGKDVPSENIRDIVDRITPAIKPVLNRAQNAKADATDRDQILAECIHSNVLTSIENLKEGSQIIRDLIGKNKLAIVGAEYDLSSGEVVFHDKVSSLHSQGQKEINGELVDEKLATNSDVSV